MAQAKQDLQAIINDAAAREGVDPELMQKIGGSESSLKASAKNPKSTAKGLFQFVDATWKEMGGKPGQQYDPRKNAELGAKYVKKNVQALAQSLGREPSHGEVYAAHVFGTTGAKTLLTKADPNAPIEQSLAMFESPKRVAKVLKQNPNLQGKTTAQVLADLDRKMGGQKPQTTAQEPVAAPAPKKESPGFFRSPVPHFIRSEAPNLGTGYNAALALMGMSDKDELEKAQETVAQAEEENSVADFGQAKQMLAGVQAPNAFANRKPMRMMADGGEVQKYADGGFTVPVQRNIYRPEDQKYLDEQLAAWDQYNAQANDYNTKLAEYNKSEPVQQYGSAVEAYNAKLQDYNATQWEPYKAQVDAYNAKLAQFNESPEYKAYQQQVDQYNAALNEYNTNVYNPYKAQVDQYNTGLETFKASDPFKNYVSAAEEYNRQVEAYNAIPALYEQDVTSATPYTGGGTYVRNRDTSATRVSIPTGYRFVARPGYQYFGDLIKTDFTGVEPTAPTYGTPVPTAPTAFSMATPTEVKFGEVAPTKPADFSMAPPAAPAGFGVPTPTQPTESIDAVMARRAQAEQVAAKDAEQRGIAIQAANNPNQYNLAGFGSAGINAPTIALMAEGGEVAPEPEKGSAKAMLKEVGRSTQYAPADIAGSPVDLINLGLKGVDAMAGTKLAQEMPVGGAEWIISKAHEYGLMDKPTGSTTETVTRFATGLASPGAVVKGAAMAGGKAATMSRKALDEAYELSGMSRAKKAASAAEEAPVVAPKAAPAPVVEQAPKSQSRSMLDEIDPEIQKLITAPKTQPRFQGPELPERTLTTPTKDRPFVSPLDKFFAQGNNPVTVEQLTNQLAKGSRDYEMKRVAQLLEGKSPKDKVRPADLLRQLEETSPSRFRVEIKEPDPKNMGQFYASMENPYPSKPMGAVNLLEDITPQEKLASAYMRDIRYNKGYDYKHARDEDAQKATAALELFFKSPMAKEAVGQNLAAQFKVDAPKIRQLNKQITEIRDDMQAVGMPYTGSRRFDFDYMGEQLKIRKQILQERPELVNKKDGGQTLASIVDPLIDTKAENVILKGLDTKYGTNLVGYRESMGDDWTKMTSYDKTKAVERMLGDVVGSEYTGAQVKLNELQRPYESAMSLVQKQVTPYTGQHSNIASKKPISFSRFQDVTLPTKENVMVIPELQSDRYDDLLKSGAKGGNQYKDSDELAQLEQDLDSVTRKLYRAGDAKNAALRDQLKLEGKKIEQRMGNLRERLAAGNYSTPEFTPGIERMPQVMQQIMLKNAVHAGIQRGKNGVLFPGSDSAQAQLYEKLPNNIRSVLKDLGPGFEMRKVPLQYENGSTIDRYGIFWKDDAAQRVSKEGVRFKKGGMVDKNDDENQKYI